MKVINISTKITGGAGIAARNFHQNLILNGHLSILLNGYEEEKKSSIFKINSKFSLFCNKIISKIYSIFYVHKKIFFIIIISLK